MYRRGKLRIDTPATARDEQQPNGRIHKRREIGEAKVAPNRDKDVLEINWNWPLRKPGGRRERARSRTVFSGLPSPLRYGKFVNGRGLSCNGQLPPASIARKRRFFCSSIRRGSQDTSPSLWTATDGGRADGICRAWPGTGPVWNPCVRRWKRQHELACPG